MIVNVRQFAQQRLRDLAIGRNDDLAGLGINHIQRNFFAEQNIRERVRELLGQLLLLASVLFVNRFKLAFRFRGREFFARNFAARRNFYVHDDAIRARRNGQRCVFNVRRFFTKDRAQQTFFRRELRFTLGRNFANEDVAGFHFRADTNDTVRA